VVALLEQDGQQPQLFQMFDGHESTYVDPGGVRSGGHPLRHFRTELSTPGKRDSLAVNRAAGGASIIEIIDFSVETDSRGV
jgi:hypothetical protein